MAEKIQDKHSIRPLWDTFLYLQRKWKDSLCGCMCSAGSNQIILPTYCDSEFDLFVSVQTNTQLDFPPCIDCTCRPQIVTETQGQQKMFNSSSEQHNPPRNKMWFTLSWPRRGFHRSVTVRMPTRSMVHETASFYWHGIQSVPPGYMSLALQWGPPITALPAPAHILLPNPF